MRRCRVRPRKIQRFFPVPNVAAVEAIQKI